MADAVAICCSAVPDSGQVSFKTSTTLRRDSSKDGWVTRHGNKGRSLGEGTEENL